MPSMSRRPVRDGGFVSSGSTRAAAIGSRSVGSGGGVGVGSGVGVGLGVGWVGGGARGGRGSGGSAWGSASVSGSGWLGVGVVVGEWGVGVGRSGWAWVQAGPSATRRSRRGTGRAAGGAARPCGMGALDDQVSRVVVRVLPFPAGRRDGAPRWILLPAPAPPPPRRSRWSRRPSPSASIGAPPMGRTASAPPVAAKPPEYVASAAPREPGGVRDQHVPARLQDLVTAHVALRVTVDPVDVT